MKKILVLIVMVLFCTLALADKHGHGHWKERDRGDVYFRGTPNGWGLTPMNQIGDNLYDIDVRFTYTNDGNPRFKINVDRDWKEAYPNRDYRINSEGDYHIVFNSRTKEIFVTKKEEQKKVIEVIEKSPAPQEKVIEKSPPKKTIGSAHSSLNGTSVDSNANIKFSIEVNN